MYHLTRRRQGKMRRALPCPETLRRPSIPRPWRGRCSTNRPQAAFPAPSWLRPASISKTPAAARPRLHPAPRPAPKARFENRLPHLPRARRELHPSRRGARAHSPAPFPKGCAAPPAGLHWTPAPAAWPRTPAAARRSAPGARALPACTGSQPPERRPLFTGRQTPEIAAQRAAAWPLPFGLFFVRHSGKGKKKQAAPTALPA